MKNYIQDGMRMNYTPSSAVTSGQAVLVGSKIGVAVADIAANATGALAMDGVFELPKVTTDVVAQGDALYWDNTAKKLTKTATNNTYAGYAVEAAGNGTTTVKVRINR
jgi:predicted RecA/RadA family phage recombinase